MWSTYPAFVIKEQNLECISIHDNYAYGQGLSIIFVIKDNEGEINNYEERYSGITGRETAIINGIKFMMKHGFLHTWEAIYFNREYLKLQERINELQIENAKLKKIIEKQ